MYTIDLVRHAESAWVEEADKMPVPVFGGRMLEVPLSKKGRNQARAFGRYLLPQRVQPSAFYASRAARAVETYTCAMEAYREDARRPVKEFSYFDELDWGEWEQQPRSVANEPRFQAQLRRDGFDFRPPRGESFRQVQYRATTGLIKALSAQPSGSRVMVFTHKNVIKSLVYPLLGWTVEQLHAANVAVLSITRLTYTHRKDLQLEFFNRPTVVIPR